ncbi:MAG: M24 family metallopeptidase [Christensenellales bacterium]
MTRTQESLGKIEAVRKKLAELDVKGVAINHQNNFSWITSGGRGFIGIASEGACGTVVITQDKAYLFTNNIEGPRLMDEEIPEGVLEPVIVPWQQAHTIGDKIVEVVGGPVATDAELNDFFVLERSVFNENEIQRFKVLGEKVTSLFEGICLSLERGMTEFDVAAQIAKSHWENGIEPVNHLIACDSRSYKYRHFVPTMGKIDKGVIVSMCARAQGLVVSITRNVDFDGGAFSVNYEKLVKVEADTINAIAQDVTMQELYDITTAAYTRHGLDGEFNKHHQGGPIGYAPRESLIKPGNPLKVRTNSAYAFNPSAISAKCEDSVLWDGEKLIHLTYPGENWPKIEVGGIIRPGVLYR